MITFRHPWITDWLTWVRVDGLFQFLFSQAVQNWHERQHKKKEKKKVSHSLFFCHVFLPFLPCLFCICLRYWNLRPIVFYGGYTFWICRLNHLDYSTVFPRILFVETILFWKWKMWKFSYSFRILAIFYFTSWIVAA